MPRLWLTYAWRDNDDQQIDFVVQALEAKGLTVKFDRAHLIPGQRLWANLDKAITDPTVTDAWAIYVTKASLSSEPCQEELAYALDRALRTRGQDFPLIGIFPEPVDRTLVPSAIATRVYVNLSDPNWAQQVADGAARQPPTVKTRVPSFIVGRHMNGGNPVLELRPRAGRWHPVVVVVPEGERDRIKQAFYGPSGAIPLASMTYTEWVSGKSRDGRPYAGLKVGHAVDNLHSVYVEFSRLPSEICFGDPSGDLYQLPLP